MPGPVIPVEICVESAGTALVRRSVGNAFDGGAARIELCAAMDEDGLTPTDEEIRAAREAFRDRPGLIVMIRPRGGDFCYTEAEARAMQASIAAAAAAGADGVALGAVRDGRPDLQVLEPLLEEARAHGLAVTFHRAIDACDDPVEALDTLIRLGVRRVLTAGLPWGAPGSAVDGLGRIRQMIAAAAGRIEVIVGGGVGPGNVPQLRDALPAAGLVSFHAYSSVRDGGATSADLVLSLVAAANPC